MAATEIADEGDKLTQALLAKITDPTLRASVLRKAQEVKTQKAVMQSQIEKVLAELLSPLTVPAEEWDQAHVTSQTGFRMRRLGTLVQAYREMLTVDQRELHAVLEATRIGPIATSIVRRTTLQEKS